MSGKWIERAEIGTPGEFDHVSDDELEAALRERLASLCFAPPLAIGDGSIPLNGASRTLKDRDRLQARRTSPDP